MARTSILTALSIILGFGVPALSVYSSAQYGFNFIVAGIISIFALIVAGILTVLGIFLGVPVLSRLFRTRQTSLLRREFALKTSSATIFLGES
jgi:hypothetical protein